MTKAGQFLVNCKGDSIIAVTQQMSLETSIILQRCANLHALLHSVRPTRIPSHL